MTVYKRVRAGSYHPTDATNSGKVVPFLEALRFTLPFSGNNNPWFSILDKLVQNSVQTAVFDRVKRIRFVGGVAA